jgi:Tfp pilus assembly protein PilN
MNDVNLIPAARLASKRRMARLRIWAVICGAYLTLLTVVLLCTHTVCRGNGAVAKELKSAEQRVQRYNAMIIGLREELAKTRMALEMSRAISSQPDWSKLLTLLSDQLGEEVVLNNCQLVVTDKDGKEAPGHLQKSFSASGAGTPLAERRHKLELSGFGRTQSSVSRFVLRLEKIGVFDSVRLINSYRQPFLNDQAVAFSVQCTI